MDTFLRIIDKITEYSGRYSSYLLVPVILTVVYSVILRYCFNDIVHWAFEVSLFLYGIFVMMGGAYTLKVQVTCAGRHFTGAPQPQVELLP